MELPTFHIEGWEDTVEIPISVGGKVNLQPLLERVEAPEVHAMWNALVTGEVEHEWVPCSAFINVCTIGDALTFFSGYCEGTGDG